MIEPEIVEEKTAKHNYIFPDFLAKSMAKVDLRTQYEAGMLSMSFMMIGMIITITYLIIYLNFAWWHADFSSTSL